MSNDMVVLCTLTCLLCIDVRILVMLLDRKLANQIIMLDFDFDQNSLKFDRKRGKKE